MSTYSVAQAKNQLSSLIDQAMNGEPVVITRHGQPVVELKAVARKGRPMTAEDVAWLQARRVKLLKPDNDPVSVVERMRDEDLERLLRR
jgi:prevent-host-death family protein